MPLTLAHNLPWTKINNLIDGCATIFSYQELIFEASFFGFIQTTTSTESMVSKQRYYNKIPVNATL